MPGLRAPPGRASSEPAEAQAFRVSPAALPPSCVPWGRAAVPGLWLCPQGHFVGWCSLGSWAGLPRSVVVGTPVTVAPPGLPFRGGPHFSGLSPAAPASCRLNSTEYGELCEKLWAPIRSAANVVIRQSLGDLFLETFASLVEANPVYSVPSSQVGG